ncbi:MAG: Gfo/Idh/MocA family oxidoreductase [Kiritimatiellae bacterium]|nr:Gfo/Idh/MocA family oxidoreductase [Kiritimatiellia bacterium]
MRDAIRIAVIGAGANTRRMHLPRLRAIPGVRVIGVVNRTPASSEQVAREFEIPKVYRDWREAAEDPEADAVVIGTWPSLHAPATIAALGAGKHVLCEARMAMNAAEAHAMLAAARARPQLVAQLVPAPFTLGVDPTIRRWLDEGRLGELRAIEVRDSFGWDDPAAPLSWRQDARRSGLNTMWLGIAAETVMRWVGAATRVIAMGRVWHRTRLDAEGHRVAVEIPDHLEVLAEMACGAQLYVRESGVTAPAVAPGATLYGSAGALRVYEGRLFHAPRGRDDFEPLDVPESERGGWRVEEEFIAAIRGEAPVRLTTFEDGVRYMEFTEAVWRSLAQSRAVALPLALDAGGAPGPLAR